MIHAHRQRAEIVQAGDFISPAATASMMPGSRLMRVPWLNSAYSKPKVADLAQHGAAVRVPVRIPTGGKRIHKKKAECGHQFDRIRPGEFKGLQIRVTRGQHGGEPGRFHLATAAFARLFKVPVIAHDLQGSFAVDFLLQSPQGLFNWLAFFKFYFGQINSHPLRGPWNRRS